MKIRGITIWVATASVAAMMTTSASSAPLSPSGPWQLEYADSSCRLSRPFNTGKSAINLRLSRGSTISDVGFTIEGETLPKVYKKVDLKISVQPSGQMAEASALPMLMRADGKEIIQYVWTDEGAAFVKSIADSGTLAIQYSKKDNVELTFSGLHKALAALQKCHDDLLTNVYQMDVAFLRSLQSEPQPDKDVAMWVTTDDIPTEALRNHWEGTTQMLIMVDEKGQVASCKNITSSGHAILDARACEMMTRRGSFKPAMDKGGKAVTAPWIRSVRWQIPK